MIVIMKTISSCVYNLTVPYNGIHLSSVTCLTFCRIWSKQIVEQGLSKTRRMEQQLPTNYGKAANGKIKWNDGTTSVSLCTTSVNL